MKTNATQLRGAGMISFHRRQSRSSSRQSAKLTESILIYTRLISLFARLHSRIPSLAIAYSESVLSSQLKYLLRFWLKDSSNRSSSYCSESKIARLMQPRSHLLGVRAELSAIFTASRRLRWLLRASVTMVMATLSSRKYSKR